MEDSMYIAGSIVPSCVKIVEPMVEKISGTFPEADMFGVTPDHAYAYRLLDAASDVYSRWFMVMKAAISRERVRQRLYCEDNGLSVNSKVAYEQPILTASEESVVSMCYTLVKTLFDHKVAEYAMLKFNKALATGDKRSFKIRLLVLKSRDSLKGTRLYNGFRDGAENCISRAEMAAGCIPDPSPRRLSNAEKAREELKKRTASQPTLFDDASYSTDKDIDLEYNVDKLVITSQVENRKEINNIEGYGNVSPQNDDFSSKNVTISDTSGESSPASSSEGEDRDKIKDVDKGNVTVTKRRGRHKKGCVTVTDHREDNVKRKTKLYLNTVEIANDIVDGNITPYNTNEEIINDIKNKVITPMEAVLFMSELVKRKKASFVPQLGEAILRGVDKMASEAEERSVGKVKIPVEDMKDDLENEDDECQDSISECDDIRGYGEGYGSVDASESEWRPDDNW